MLFFALSVLIGLTLKCAALQGQAAIWVAFTTKDTATPYDPYSYLHPKAIERRLREGRPLHDYSDLPLNPSFVAGVNRLGCQPRFESRWLNGMVVLGQAEILPKLKALPYVQNAFLLPPQSQLASQCPEGPATPASHADLRILASLQTEVFEAREFWNRNLLGQGVRVCILDAGFSGASQHPQLGHLYRNGQIISTYDFIRQDSNVYHGAAHGTMVLSCMAGVWDTTRMGCAPQAEFILGRTEKTLTERMNEELWWLAGMEWADRMGADIINSSLGYTHKRYFIEDMDGVTSLVARAANLAAYKGILVCASAGNDGDGWWKLICTPGDADSALTVGGVDPDTWLHSSFSSFGPTSDGRLKPNVAGFGSAAVCNANGGISAASGTSFASPLVAGFAACLRQAYPSDTWSQLFNRMQAAGHLHPYFDYMHGYGIPKATRALAASPQTTSPTFTLSVSNDSLFLRLAPPVGNKLANYVYLHAQGAQNRLLFYRVLNQASISPETGILIRDKENRNIQMLRIHYQGHTHEIKIR